MPFLRPANFTKPSESISLWRQNMRSTRCSQHVHLPQHQESCSSEPEDISQEMLKKAWVRGSVAEASLTVLNIRHMSSTHMRAECQEDIPRFKWVGWGLQNLVVCIWFCVWVHGVCVHICSGAHSLDLITNREARRGHMFLSTILLLFGGGWGSKVFPWHWSSLVFFLARLIISCLSSLELELQVSDRCPAYCVCIEILTLVLMIMQQGLSITHYLFHPWKQAFI